eukprot:scaffold323_cov414-Prasinococcus_capsulatus_cf.AAC.54
MSSQQVLLPTTPTRASKGRWSQGVRQGLTPFGFVGLPMIRFKSKLSRKRSQVSPRPLLPLKCTPTSHFLRRQAPSHSDASMSTSDGHVCLRLCASGSRVLLQQYLVADPAAAFERLTPGAGKRGTQHEDRASTRGSQDKPAALRGGCCGPSPLPLPPPSTRVGSQGAATGPQVPSHSPAAPSSYLGRREGARVSNAAAQRSADLRACVSRVGASSAPTTEPGRRRCDRSHPGIACPHVRARGQPPPGPQTVPRGPPWPPPRGPVRGARSRTGEAADGSWSAGNEAAVQSRAPLAPPPASERALAPPSRGAAGLTHPGCCTIKRAGGQLSGRVAEGIFRTWTLVASIQASLIASAARLGSHETATVNSGVHESAHSLCGSQEAVLTAGKTGSEHGRVCCLFHKTASRRTQAHAERDHLRRPLSHNSMGSGACARALLLACCAYGVSAQLLLADPPAGSQVNVTLFDRLSWIAPQTINSQLAEAACASYSEDCLANNGICLDGTK